MRDTDLLDEDVISFKQARTQEIPHRDGKPVAPSTLWRWAKKGVRGPDGGRIRLETVYIGRSPHTTRQALSRFFQRLTDARVHREDEAAGEPGTRSEATERRLEEAGLLEQ